MNKPITIVIKETKKKIVEICNESSLPTFILDLIISEIYSNIHSIAEKQTFEEEIAYKSMVEEQQKVDSETKNKVNNT